MSTPPWCAGLAADESASNWRLQRSARKQVLAMRLCKFLAILVAVLTDGIGHLGAKPQVNVTEGAGYVGGIAGTHFCACARWPASWAELRGFDDRLHALSQRLGEKPVARISWSDLANSVTRELDDGTLAIRLSVRGRKEISSIGVRRPDCSSFHPEAMAEVCTPHDAATKER